MELLSIDQVAKLTGLSKNYLYELTSTKQIPHLKLKPTKFGHLRFERKKIEKWAELKSIPISSGPLLDHAEIIEEAGRPKPWGWMPEQNE